MVTLQQLDMNILLWIQEHLRVDALTPFWRAVTFLGNGGWFWIVLCVLLICFGKTRKTGVTAALSLLSGFLITNLLIKNAVARPRPFDTYTQIIPLITRPKDYSFPTGHTCASFAVALVCLRMLPGKWGILPVVLAGMTEKDTIHGERGQIQNMLVHHNERIWGSWTREFRTTQEEVNINFKPLYEVADETYTVYFINENGD